MVFTKMKKQYIPHVLLSTLVLIASISFGSAFAPLSNGGIATRTSTTSLASSLSSFDHVSNAKRRTELRHSPLFVVQQLNNSKQQSKFRFGRRDNDDNVAVVNSPLSTINKLQTAMTSAAVCLLTWCGPTRCNVANAASTTATTTTSIVPVLRKIVIAIVAIVISANLATRFITPKSKQQEEKEATEQSTTEMEGAKELEENRVKAKVAKVMEEEIARKKAVEEAKIAAQLKIAEENAKKKITEEEAKKAAEVKAAEEAKKAAESKAAEEAKKAAEAKAAEEAKKAAELKAVEEAKKAAEAEAAEEAKKAAEAKAAEEAKNAAQAKAAEEEARKAAVAKVAEEAQKDATEAKTTPAESSPVTTTKQPKTQEDEAALSARYAAIEDLEERAFTILKDLGMIDINVDPDDESYDSSEDHLPCPENIMKP